MSHTLSHLFELARTIPRLPVATLEFRLAINPDDVGKVHRYYTRPHPKYLIFQNKSLGAALVDLGRFSTREEYMATIKGSNSAEKYAAKAKRKGYRVVEIERNDFIDDIHEINNAEAIRQGRPMDPSYREKRLVYPIEKNYKYYGVLSSAGKLMAYGDLGFYGNFFSFNRVLGVRNNDGIMHLMVTEIICHLIESRNSRYLMYDTYFGASDGLRAFKTMLGFEPYRAKYSLQ